MNYTPMTLKYRCQSHLGGWKTAQSTNLKTLVAGIRHFKVSWVFAPLILMSFSSCLQAEEIDWDKRLQVHGFASQAYVHTSDNRFFGDSDEGSFEFTELGLNASYRLSPKIRLAGQVLSRKAGDFDNGSPRIDYALLDANLLGTPTFTGGLYLGRIKNPIGLYNQTRDVAHTREGIFLPQAIYFDKVRDLLVSSDGIQLYGHYYLDNGTLLIQGGAGYAIADKNVEYTFMGRDWAGELENNDLSFVGRVLYEHNGGRWVYALTGVSSTIDFHAGAADRVPFPAGAGLSSGELQIDYTVLSAQYNGEKWQLTAEAAYEDTEYVGISDSFAARNFESLGYFVQANYNFTPQWQAFLRYEAFHDINDWDGEETAQRSRESSQFLLDNFGIVQIPSPAHNNYSKAWVFGGRWHINPSLMLRAEYHIIEGTSILSPREEFRPLAEKNWDMFAASLSYRF